MIDISKAKWELSPEEKYVVKWFDEHGFAGVLVRQYVSKTIFKINKNGISDNFELPQGVKDLSPARRMKQFERQFDTLCELRQLREKAASI